jgi:hypothetical protein
MEGIFVKLAFGLLYCEFAAERHAHPCLIALRLSVGNHLSHRFPEFGCRKKVSDVKAVKTCMARDSVAR